MPGAIRLVRLSCLGFFVLAAVGGAWAANSGSANSDAGDAAKQAALAEAIAACDRGAAIPLDPDAKAAPVQFGELLLSDVNKQRRRELSRQCQKAALGAPQEKRLQLQWLRVQVSLDEPGLVWLIPQVKAFADSGSAEADYLLFQIFNRHRNDADTSVLVISRDAALDSLHAAAQLGHLDALQMLLQQYRGGPLLRRDAHKAVETAERILNAPPQGLAPTEHDEKMRSSMPYTIAVVTLEREGFTAAEQQNAFALIEARVNSTPGNKSAALAYLSALRFGRGTAQDAAKARQLLEARAAADEGFVPMLADMVARGEGGPADGKRAIAMLRDDRLKHVYTAGPVLAELLLDGKIVGRQPREAIRALLGSFDLDASIRAAGLLVDYHQQVEHEQNLVRKLSDAATAGEPGAALALARLQLSDNPQFRDEDSARTVLKVLAEQGDRAALWLYASTQYANLDSTGSRPYLRPGGLSDKQLKSLVDEGAAKKEPEALLLLAKLSRRGALYPQDDEAATKLLTSAANLGSVEAMVLLGDAYDDGLGIDKNPRERLRAWREAARLGSLEAKAKLATAFIFDFSDRLLTLREGITGRIALYIDGVGGTGSAIGAQFASMFSGSRASDAGAAALAEAVMDAFREAPAGLEEEILVSIGKALPDEIRMAVEERLKADGFYAGEPKGYFGPEARKALAAWVDAKGPLGDIAEPPAVGEVQQGEDVVATEIIDRLRDRAFEMGMAAKTDDERLEALGLLNALARYGDIAPRWALVRNYHQAKVVRSVVTPAEVVRYALDLLVTRPPSVEKAEFEFALDLARIAEDGKFDTVGDATLAAIRDDPRLHDPLTLGGIMRQFVMLAPGACDAVLDAAKRAGVPGLGSDGCGENARAALVQFAKAQGPAGVDAAARKAAALEIKSLDEQAAR